MANGYLQGYQPGPLGYASGYMPQGGMIGGMNAGSIGPSFYGSNTPWGSPANSTGSTWNNMSPWQKAGTGLAIGGAAGGLLGGLFGGGSAAGDYDKANEEYQKYLHEGLGVLQGGESQGRGDLQQYLQQALGYMTPYSQAGQQALGDYMGSLGMSGGGSQQKAYDQFTASPGYQFALNQGINATSRGMQAKGLGGSGAEQKALTQYGQGMANQEFGNWQQKLAGLAGAGQQAAGQMGGWATGTGGALANLGLGYAGQEANLYGQMGQSAAEAEMAKAQASQNSGLWSGLGSLAGAALPFLL